MIGQHKGKGMITIAALILAVMLSFGIADSSYAASGKKPAVPKITSASANGTTVTLSWAKAKNAKKYHIAVQTDYKVWKKYKTVKKSKKNKKKFTKPGQYKVKAKGKKYIVYKYTYDFDVQKIVSKRTVAFPRLGSNRNYTFAVRAVNGSKQSKWRYVTVKTGFHSEWVKINGRSMLVTEGKKVTLPLPAIPGVTIGKQTVDIIPERDDFYDFYDGEEGDIRIEGKDPSGFVASYVYYPGNFFVYTKGKIASWDDRRKIGYLSYGSQYMSWPEEFTIKIVADNMKAVWTLDGTEPQFNQEDKYIPASQYPFGTWTKGGEIRMRGTTTSSYNIPEVRWANSRGYGVQRSAPIVVWAKLYQGNTLIQEEILYDQE